MNLGVIVDCFAHTARIGRIAGRGAVGRVGKPGSRAQVVERVVWEVVSDLAETMMKEEIRRLTAG